MVAVGGGKSRKEQLPSQPQVVVQLAADLNQYLLIKIDEDRNASLVWIGDPNAATKFNSKYEAKSRVRDMTDIPATRTFHTLPWKGQK